MAGPVRKPRSRSNATPSEGRHFVLNLNKPITIVIAVVLVTVVGWSFFMGFMIGRGHNPEKHLEEMADIFHPSQPVKPDSPVTDKPDKAAPTDAPSTGSPAQNDTSAQAAPVNPPQPPAAQTQQGDIAHKRPTGEALAAWGQKPAVPEPNAPDAKSGAKSVQASPPQPRFDFTYQAAAFRKTEEAETVRHRLEAAGIRATVQKSGKVYLIMVKLRGSDDDAAKLRAQLKQMKLGTPLLQSRKAVTDKKTSPKGRKQ